MKTNFGLANSADPDVMSHYAAFRLGLQCLSKYPFRGSRYTKCLVKSTLECFHIDYNSVTLSKNANIILLRMNYDFFESGVRGQNFE